MKRRILSLLLVCIMVLGILPVSAFATDGEDTPNAIVTVMDPVTLTKADHQYICWPSGDNNVDRPLEIVMNFKAQDNAEDEDIANHPYAKWLVDFYLTIGGLTGDSIVADNCYLAGNYGSFGWIVIPTDGLEIEEGVSYPVVSGYDATLNYKDICTSVKDFTAAIHIDEAILDANPDMTVTLELKMTDPNNAENVITIGKPAVYTATELTYKESTEGSAPSTDTPDFSIDISDNIVIEGIADGALVVSELQNNTALKEEGYNPLAGNVKGSDGEVIKDFKVALSYINMGDALKIKYVVEPLDGENNKVDTLTTPITFRLPIPDSIYNAGIRAVTVTHDDEPMEGTYTIFGNEGGYYIEVTSATFSEFAVEAVVAQIKDGEAYTTLADAIANAEPDDEIVLLANVSEDVTINKNLTISGAKYNYTGKMTVYGNVNVTIEDVNFIKGYIDDPDNSHGYLTVKNCDFDGVDKSIGYAISVRGGDELVIENCTAKNYKTGMLYVPSAVAEISIKDVTALNVSAAFNITYSGDATFENVAFENVTYGIHFQIYGSRTYTVKNSDLSGATNPFWFWDKSNKTAKVTVVFEGENTVPTFQSLDLSEKSGELKMAAGATLIAPEDLVITAVDADNYEVKYENGKYVAVELPKAAEIVGKGKYETLQVAIDAAESGDTVKLIKGINIEEVTPSTLDGSYNSYAVVEGKNITIDLNGKTISGAYTDTSKMLVGVFSTDKGGHLTLTGNGTVDITATGTVYSLFSNYNPGCSITINGGTYKLDKASNCLIHTAATAHEGEGDEGVVINGGSFHLGNVGANGKAGNYGPWLINANGNGERHAWVTGGTFNADINHQYWIHEVQLPATKAVKDNGDGTWTVVDAQAYIAEMHDGYEHQVGYTTLAEAIEAAKNGETVTLLEDINLTDNQYVKKQITIDLGGKKLSSTGVRTLVAYGSNGVLTVQNGTVSSDTSGTLTATYNGKLILGNNLTVNSTGNFGVYINRGKVEVPADTENLFVTGKSKAVGVKAHDDNVFDIMAGMYNTNPGFVANGYGVVTEQVDDKTWYKVVAPVAYINKEGKLSSAAKLQDAIDNALDGSTITLNTDFYLYANKLTSKAKTEGTDLVNIGDYNAFFVLDKGQTLTIDLNGHNLLGYTRSAPTMVIGMFATNNNSHLTLKDSVGDALVRITSQNANVYALLTNYSEDSSITIEGGNYELDKASDCLIYSAATANEGVGNTGVIVNGGNFKLGNVGANGQSGNYGPWIFNARGQNHRHNWITGGTFNADIMHQYWIFEAQMPEDKALQKNDDGTWTVVDAVAYVTEREWSSKWYTRNVGYTTVQAALNAAEGPKDKVYYGKTYTSEQEDVYIIADTTEDYNIPETFTGTLYAKDGTKIHTSSAQ